MVDPDELFMRVIQDVQQAWEMPLADTPEGHKERSDRRYELLHIASEILVLDLIPIVREEGDMFRRFDGEAT